MADRIRLHEPQRTAVRAPKTASPARIGGSCTRSLPETSCAVSGSHFGHDYRDIPVYHSLASTPGADLAVSHSGDPAEREADETARAVVEGSGPVRVTNRMGP